MKDLIIIGAGPAGITAAVYAARKQMDFMVVTGDVGGQTIWSSDVDNYPGYQHIRGVDLVKKFEEHLSEFDIDMKKELVDNLEQIEGGFRVWTKKGNSYESKTVIVAAGKEPRRLDVKGEKEYENKGVTYCATCDAPLFKDKDVVVIGGANSALDAVLQLIKIANKIYLINIGSELGGDAIMKEKVEQSDKVEVINNAKTTEIYGEVMVTGIKIDVNGEQRDLPVQGVFVEVGLIPGVDFIDFVEKNEKGEIIVDHGCFTSVPGLFAAGDVTNVVEKQIVVAAGEGCKALLECFTYLAKQK